jgi:hypothetical protein
VKGKRSAAAVLLRVSVAGAVSAAVGVSMVLRVSAADRNRSAWWHLLVARQEPSPVAGADPVRKPAAVMSQEERLPAVALVSEERLPVVAVALEERPPAEGVGSEERLPAVALVSEERPPAVAVVSEERLPLAGVSEERLPAEGVVSEERPPVVGEGQFLSRRLWARSTPRSC